MERSLAPLPRDLSGAVRSAIGWKVVVFKAPTIRKKRPASVLGGAWSNERMTEASWDNSDSSSWGVAGATPSRSRLRKV